jgi:hypothetical protein
MPLLNTLSAPALIRPRHANRESITAAAAGNRLILKFLAFLLSCSSSTRASTILSLACSLSLYSRIGINPKNGYKIEAILEKSGLVFRMTYSNNVSHSIYFGRFTKQTLAHLASKCVYWRFNRATPRSNNIRTQNDKFIKIKIIIRNDVMTEAKVTCSKRSC